MSDSCQIRLHCASLETVEKQLGHKLRQNAFGRRVRGDTMMKTKTVVSATTRLVGLQSRGCQSCCKQLLNNRDQLGDVQSGCSVTNSSTSASCMTAGTGFTSCDWEKNDCTLCHDEEQASYQVHYLPFLAVPRVQNGHRCCIVYVCCDQGSTPAGAPCCANKYHRDDLL